MKWIPTQENQSIQEEPFNKQVKKENDDSDHQVEPHKPSSFMKTMLTCGIFGNDFFVFLHILFCEIKWCGFIVVWCIHMLWLKIKLATM
jgi:hypothetical protein